jgi:hypothetical protein
MIHSKKCFKCNSVKPLSDFYKHLEMADGHVNKCKECNKKDVTKNRNQNIERFREYDRFRGKNSKRIALAVKVNKAWRAEDSKRSAAHSAVARAIKSGALVKQNCAKCNDENSLAHHEDYDKKLDVVWLCQPCHKQRHKEIILGV